VDKERGAVAVEAALVMLPLSALLVGGVTLGLVAYQRQSVNAVTIEAAAYGAEADPADADWHDRVLAIAVSVNPDASACVAYIEPGQPTHWWRQNPTGGQTTGPGKCWADDRPADEARVQVQTDAPGHIDAVYTGWDVALSARSIAAVRGAGDASPSPSPSPTSS
jgi:Flp pilus assembly protein TadG